MDLHEPDFDYVDEARFDATRPDTASADMNRKQVIELLKHSADFIIEFFLGEDLTFKVPQLHKDVWFWFTNIELIRILLAIPRDHAKTTLAKIGVIWYWLFTDHRFCIYLSSTLSKSKDACRDIMGFLKCDNFRAVFGDIHILKESETEGVWIFDMPMGNGRRKRCILRSLGSNNSVRGINIDNQRPDIAIVDDAEDEEIVNSPKVIQPKFDKWFYGSFLKALARRKKIIWLGNMLATTQLLARAATKSYWNPVIFGALVRNNITGQLQALWEDRWPIEELIEDFNEYRDLGLSETWMCEMMNMPGHGVNGFRQEQINYQPIPSPDGIKAAWITIDPAFGMKQANDNTCIAVHVLPEDGCPMVANQITGKFSEAEIFDHAFRLGMYWNAWVWGIEAVAAQRVLITLFRVLAITKGMASQIEFIPLISGTKDPKASRISSWVSLMEAGEYAIHDGDVEITAQVLSYDLTKKDQSDDTIDACAYGPQMLERYEGLLIHQFSGSRYTGSRGKTGRRVAGV